MSASHVSSETEELMRTVTLAGILILVLVLAGCPLAAQDKDKFDPAKLVGTWTYVSGEKNGEKLGEDRLKNQTVTITKETWTLKADDKFVMKYELDTKQNPVGIKFTMTESPFGPGAVAKGIIELKGDELKLAYHPMDGDAPKKFEAKEGSNHHYFVLKRSK
jgi:uncharacterized protein (TIGR03067 family)